MSTPSTEHVRGWTDIRTVGPALMILFGLVLMFAPLASVGASGSVGNAGAQFPKCGPNDEDCGQPPTTDCPPGGGQAGGGAFVGPDDCPPVTAPPSSTAAPTTAPPSTTTPPTTEPATAPAEATGGDEAPVAQEDDGAEVLGLTEASAPPAEVPDVATADAAETTELAFTGPDGGTAIASGVGAVLVLGGAALLFMSRRRSL